MVKNKLLITVCAAALATGLSIGAASAQDESNWEGFYGGIHTGYGKADLDISYTDEASSSAASFVTDLDGGFVGFHAGYNWQWTQNAVIGVEADFNWNVFEWEEINAPWLTTDGFVGDSDYLASLRARLGTDIGGDALVYVTGGVAYTDTEATLHAPSIPEKVDWDWGGVVGAGVEYGIAENLSFRAEGLYYFFGEEDWVCQTSCYDTPGKSYGDIDLNIFTFRVGISYQFGN